MSTDVLQKIWVAAPNDASASKPGYVTVVNFGFAVWRCKGAYPAKSIVETIPFEGLSLPSLVDANKDRNLPGWGMDSRHLPLHINYRRLEIPMVDIGVLVIPIYIIYQSQQREQLGTVENRRGSAPVIRDSPRRDNA